MSRQYIGRNVFDAVLDRYKEMYREGHRIVLAFSGGKDSTIVLELGIMAAREVGCLPVEVIMRDEEVMYPGTFEYSERVANRPEVDFHWVYAHQPVTNVYNRREPYFWVFDPWLDEDKWMRKPPSDAYRIYDIDLNAIVTAERFPPAPDKDVFVTLGLRTAESVQRTLGMYSSASYLTKVNKWGVRKFRPIYDWEDGDVWLAIKEFEWDYNPAYDAMVRYGIPNNLTRIAPPTLISSGFKLLKASEQLWPNWFDRLSNRLEGVRMAAQFGKRFLEPQRRINESWEECFYRTCVTTAPDWIAERAVKAANIILDQHMLHSSMPFPQAVPCLNCHSKVQCWRQLALAMYSGDCFCLRIGHEILDEVHPDFFRPGWGIWDKKEQAEFEMD